MILNLRIQPKASRDGFDGLWLEAMGKEQNDTAVSRMKLRLMAPPIDGKANKYLQAWLAKTFKVPKSTIEILTGHKGRNKRVRIPSPTKLPIELSKD